MMFQGGDIGNYEFIQVLEMRNISQSYLARHKQTNCYSIIKRYNKDESNIMPIVQREVMILRSIDHPFIQKLFDFVEDSQYVHLVVEFSEEGSLASYVNRNGPIGEQQARVILAQIVSALQYLHSEKRILHQNIRAENVRLDRNKNIRLSEFGFSSVANSTNSWSNSLSGLPTYSSPEVLMEQPYSPASDIWSVGVLLFAITSSQHPFDDNHIGRLTNKIINEDPKYPTIFSPMLSDLLHRMLMKDPTQRITLEGIIQHPWFLNGKIGERITYNFNLIDRYRLAKDPSHSCVLDPEVLYQVQMFGVDPEILQENLACDQIDSDTAIYKQLLRQKMTDELVPLMEEFIQAHTNSTQSNTTLSFTCQNRLHLSSLVNLPPLSNSTANQRQPSSQTSVLRNPMGTRNVMIQRITPRGIAALQLRKSISPKSKQEEVRIRSGLSVKYVSPRPT